MFEFSDISAMTSYCKKNKSDWTWFCPNLEIRNTVYLKIRESRKNKVGKTAVEVLGTGIPLDWKCC